MFEAIRKFSNSWYAKMLLGFVIICFALIWGTPLFRINSENYVITSGKTAVTKNQFIFYVDKSLAMISKQFNLPGRFNAARAQQLGILDYIKSHIYINSLLDEEARLLDLGLSNSEIAKLITKDDFFKMGDKFNTSMFLNYAQRLRITKNDIIESYAREGKREQLLLALFDDIKLPKIFFNLFEQYQQQKFNIRYVKITSKNILPVAFRPEEKLKQWYNGHKVDFIKSEQRKIDIIALNKKDIKAKQKVTDQEISDYYNKNVKDYRAEQKITFDSLVFNKAEEAQQILDKIKKDNIKDLSNLKNQEQKFQFMHHNEEEFSSIEKEIGKKLLQIKENEISDIIKSQDKYYILRKIKTIPAISKELTQVKDEIKQKLINKKADEAFQKIKDAINNEIKNTAINDLAKKYDIKSEHHVVDKNGDLANSAKTKLIEDTEWQKLLRASFHTDKDKFHEPINIKDDGLVWFKVLDITPAVQKTFDEVKQEIAQNLQKKDLEQALDKRAAGLQNEIQSANNLDIIAQENNLSIYKADGIDRYGKVDSSIEKLDDSFIENIVSHNIGDVITYKPQQSDSRIIARISRIYNMPNLRTTLKKYAIDQLDNGLKEDLQYSLAKTVNKKHPIIIKTNRIKYLLSQL